MLQPGGVASAKPVAQAIVGPGGLAVARPIATAIAGVKGAGVPGAALAGGKDGVEEEGDATSGSSRQKQVYFDPQTNKLHTTPTLGQRVLYPVNLY